MKVVFLCAGYGTRLERDLVGNEEFKHLIGRPKALLPIAEKALIGYWFDDLQPLREKITEVIIVSNDKFMEQFHKSKRWYLGDRNEDQLGFKLTILNDGSTSNETRLGAVADIQFAVREAGINEDLLVVAGDTLFKNDFDLYKFIAEYEAKKESSSVSPMALITGSPCPEDQVSKHGIIEVGLDCKVTSFLEKPDPKTTASRTQSPCFYLLDPASLKLLDDFLDTTKNEPMVKRDATGNFLAYLVEHGNVFAFQTEGRYDVGNLQSYIDCCSSISSEQQ